MGLLWVLTEEVPVTLIIYSFLNRDINHNLEIFDKNRDLIFYNSRYLSGSFKNISLFR